MRDNVSFVRLIHADDNPAGPGIKEEQIDAPHVGRQQTEQITRTGSYIEVPASPTLAALTSFTLQAWIFPTLPGQGKAQTILAYGTQASACLLMNAVVGAGVGSAVPIRIEIPLRARFWYFVAKAYDLNSQTVRLYQYAVSHIQWQFCTREVTQEHIVTTTAAETPVYRSNQPGRTLHRKIDCPCLFAAH